MYQFNDIDSIDFILKEINDGGYDVLLIGYDKEDNKPYRIWFDKRQIRDIYEKMTKEYKN